MENNEGKVNRGKLKIFFGMSAGVGKTFSMLQAAVTNSAKGVDVVVCCADTHGCMQIGRMLKQLDHIPPKKGADGKVEEIDLEAIIRRRPQLAVIDELAHTNAIGSRHAKRYQDVLELLDNGIDVYTTLNLEDLESRSDNFRTHRSDTHTANAVPDDMFETADELEMVDVSSKVLLGRLSQGKVNIEPGSRMADPDYFSKKNIIARRELTLRLVADYVNKRTENPYVDNVFREDGANLMVLMGSSEFDERLIRLGKRLSYTLGMTYVALHIEQAYDRSQAEIEQLTKNIGLAKELGAKVIISAGADIVDSAARVARQEKISHIIVGQSQRHGLFARVLNHFDTAGRLARKCRDIDLFTVNQPDESRKPKIKKPSAPNESRELVIHSLIAFGSILFTLLGCLAIADVLRYETASYIIVLVAVVLSMFLSFRVMVPTIFVAAISWFYLFIPPTHSWKFIHPSDLIMTISFVIVAIIIANLMSRLRRQERLTRVQSERTTSLFHLTERLAASETLEQIVTVAEEEIGKYFNIPAQILLRDENGELSEEMADKLSPRDMKIARWSLRHSSKAGKFSNTMTDSEYTFCPLNGMTTTQGVVAILTTAKLSGDQNLFWTTFITQISNALEQHDLIMRNRKMKMKDESDMLYQTIFNSVSHELRIPVTTIMASSYTLIEDEYPQEMQKEFLAQIFTASNRLNRLIENLLNTSRIESHKLSLNRDWCDLNDLFNQVVDDLTEELKPFKVKIYVPQNMQPVRLDFGIMEQVIQNLVYNSCKYAEPGTTIRLEASYGDDSVVIREMDEGPGLSPEVLPMVFDKFYRGDRTSTGGLGLGLSIAKEFVKAHGGTIEVANRPEGGAMFTITLPA
jgi:two-component system sensor histidine kinase KdpD